MVYSWQIWDWSTSTLNILMKNESLIIGSYWLLVWFSETTKGESALNYTFGFIRSNKSADEDRLSRWNVSANFIPENVDQLNHISYHAIFISFLTVLFLVLQKVLFIITWDLSSEQHHSRNDTSIINYMPGTPCRPLSSQNPPGGWTNSNKCLSPANKPPYWSLLMFLLNQSPSPNGHFPHHISFQWETDVSEAVRRGKGPK